MAMMLSGAGTGVACGLTIGPMGNYQLAFGLLEIIIHIVGQNSFFILYLLGSFCYHGGCAII